jgi:membrane protease YdiL (CAAX protease family)
MGYWKRLWYLWGALIIKIGITYVTTLIAEIVYMTMYAYEDLNRLVEVSKDQDALMEFAAEIVEALIPYTTLMEGVAAAVTIPILFFMFRSDMKKERSVGIMPLQKAPLVKYITIFFMSIAMCIGMNNILYISGLTVVDETYVEVTEAMYAAGFGMEILCLGILVPIAEELVFRGLMYKRLRYDLAFLPAALYTGFAFAVFHGNMVQMIYAFILGMLFSYLYEKYRSVKAPIFAHIVMNLVSVFATEYQLMNWMSEEYVRIGAITVVCAAVASSMFVLVQRMEE